MNDEYRDSEGSSSHENVDSDFGLEGVDISNLDEITNNCMRERMAKHNESTYMKLIDQYL